MNSTVMHSMEPEDSAHDVYEERDFGFWLYLMTDVIIFALLFATYIVMVNNIAGGPSGRDIFSLMTAFQETLLLLTSTYTVALATLAARYGSRRQVLYGLVGTGLLGLLFLALELREFHDLVLHNTGSDRSGFLSAFFTLLGTHGLHVSVGIVWLTVMLVRVRNKGLSDHVRSQLYRFGLFWHFLDIVWVGIFSIVYLPGVI